MSEPNWTPGDPVDTWKPVVGYIDLYEVSDQGRVRSLPRPGTSGRVLQHGWHSRARRRRQA